MIKIVIITVFFKKKNQDDFNQNLVIFNDIISNITIYYF